MNLPRQILIICLLVPLSLIMIGIPLCLSFFLPLRLNIPYVGRIWKNFMSIFLRYGLNSQVTIVDERDLKKRSKLTGLIIANHQSIMDIPLLSLKTPVAPIYKKELLKIPGLNFLLIAGQGIAVDRKNALSREKAKQETQRRLQQGLPVQIYPEGTRSKTGFPKEFSEIKKSLLFFAFEQKIPITAASMAGTEKLLNGWHFVFNRPLFLKIHKPLFPQNFSNAEEFARAAWNKVEEGVKDGKKSLKEESF